MHFYAIRRVVLLPSVCGTVILYGSVCVNWKWHIGTNECMFIVIHRQKVVAVSILYPRVGYLKWQVRTAGSGTMCEDKSFYSNLDLSPASNVDSFMCLECVVFHK